MYDVKWVGCVFVINYDMFFIEDEKVYLYV